MRKTIYLFIFLIVPLAVLSVAKSATVLKPSEVFSDIDNANIETLNEVSPSSLATDKKAWQKILKDSGIDNWDPEDNPQGTLSFNGKSLWKTRPKCSAQALKKAVDASSHSGTTIKNFIERCEKKILQYPRSAFFTLYQIAQLNYDFKQHPYIKPVKLTLEDGTILRGFLGLKSDNKPRPMVIARCGLFCDADRSRSGKNMMMHLFDESPFNILFLGNSTGSHFHRDNRNIALGGFDEGIQLMNIAKIINDHPNLSQRTSSFHIATVSLGSHGALYSGLYNSYNYSLQYPKINSIIAMCPVVELQTTLQKSFTDIIRRNFFLFFFKSAIIKAYAFIPTLQEIFPDIAKIQSGAVPAALVEAAVEYYKDKGSGWTLPPFTGATINNEAEFWSLNNYLRFAHLSNTPTLVVSSKNDFIVTYEENTKRLEEALAQRPNPDLQVISLQYGSHCAPSINYSRETLSQAYRSFILSHSPTLIEEQKTVASQKFFPNPELSDGDVLFDTSWTITHQDNGQISFTIWRKGNNYCTDSEIFGPCERWSLESCADIDPYERKGPRECFRTVEQDVSNDKLKVFALNDAINETQAEAFTRWANTHLKVVNAQGKEAPYADTPKSITWQGQP